MHGAVIALNIHDLKIQAHGAPQTINPLTGAQISEYQLSNGEQNTICVANGLYLEIMDVQGNYGPVQGLFTLELLYANPGEGGGFVYADIVTSTGDFICKTPLGYTYNAFTSVEAGSSVEGLYIRVSGKGYVPATGTADGKTIYYECIKNTDEIKFMPVVDNVGGEVKQGRYEYYYWYISGATINYQVYITGYIGSDDTKFAETNIIPKHTEKLNYVLFGISEAGTSQLSAALKNGTYELVQTDAALEEQQISLEVKLGASSLGFVKYDESTDTWCIVQGTKSYAGYAGLSGEVENNILAQDFVSESGTDVITIVLHKSKEVNTEVTGMMLVIELDLFENSNVYSKGTSTLVFQNTFSIIRLVPKQSKFSDVSRLFSGVLNDFAEVQINGSSSITTEYQTKYIAMAFPLQSGRTMSWVISTQGYRYYFNQEHGTYLTLDETGNVISISPTLNYKGVGIGEIEVKEGANGGLHYVHDNQEYSLALYSSCHSAPLPKGTKITMIDLTDDKSPRYYFYLCNQAVARIDLNDFQIMGGSQTIGSLSNDISAMPAYMREYVDKQDQATRVNERLIFVFDFAQAEWGDAEFFDGMVVLQHLYNGVDIMDYVESTTVQEGNVSSVAYIRSVPKFTQYKVDVNSTGIEKCEVSADSSISELGEANITVSFKEVMEYPDTRFDEGKFTFMIEMVDPNGQAIRLPAGMYFKSGDVCYYPGLESMYVVIPADAYATQTITVCNTIYSLKEYLEASTVRFRVTLCDAPDPLFYNSILTTYSAIVSLSVSDNAEYNLSVELSERILAPGDVLQATVTTDANVSGVAVTVSLYRKTSGGYELAEFSEIFTKDASGAYKWVVAQAAASGTYRLVFTYGDRTEYQNIIISS